FVWVPVGPAGACGSDGCVVRLALAPYEPLDLKRASTSMIVQGAETLSMDRPELLTWMTRNLFFTVALLASALTLLAWALISGTRHTWTGGGFDASGPEMSRLKEMLGLRTGMVLADIGAGKGQLTLALAGGVGPAGHVFSSEINQARVQALRKAVADTRVGNVTV